MEELKGKVAIVTGASRQLGIGRACALTLARLGCDVVVTGTSRPASSFPEEERAQGWRGAESVAEEVRQLGRKALALAVDVADAEAVQRMVDETVRQLGRVDILVCSAAAPREATRIVDLPQEIWNGILDINLTGTFLCYRAVGKQFMAQGQGGSIISISSQAGRQGSALRGAYAASKFGIIGLTQSMAYEMAPYGVTVNAVCPGAVDTSRTTEATTLRAQQAGKTVAELTAETARRIPLGRMATPQDIANTVGFLATPNAAYITGQAINVTGGSYMS